MSQLPFTTANFFGREQELDHLMSGFPGHKVIVISGIPGIGKTSLGLSFAGRLNAKKAYQDRIFWITCKNGWDLDDLSTEIAQKIKEIYGIRTEISSGSKIPEKIVRILDENSLILFIDDFHLVSDQLSGRFVETVLSGLKKGKLVILSRKRAETYGVNDPDYLILNLEGMSFQDSSRMMDSYFELHEMDKLPERLKHELYRKIRGHSFSLKLMISLLVSGGYSPQYLLENPSDYLAERNRYLLDRVWERLSGKDKEIVSRLSVLRIPVFPDRLPHPDNAGTRRSMKNLRNNYLVEVNHSGAVSVHDLFKEYTDRIMDQAEKKKHHFEAALKFSQADSTPVELLEAFYHFVQAEIPERAVDTALEIHKKLLILGEKTESFDTVLAQALKLSSGYRGQEIFRARIEYLLSRKITQEVESLIASLSSKTERDLLTAELKFCLSNYSEAAEFYRKALTKLQSTEDRVGALTQLGLAYNYLGNVELSAEHLEQAIGEVDQISTPLFRARVFTSYSIFLTYRGRIEDSLKYLELAEQIFRDSGATEQLAFTLRQKAYNLRELCRREEAVVTLRRAIRIHKKIRALRDLMRDYSLLACTFTLLKRYKDSIRILRKALKTASKFSWTFEQASLQRGVGEVCTYTGDNAEAELSFKKALELYEKIDFPTNKIWAHQLYAQFLLINNEPARALPHLELAGKFSEQSDNRELLVYFYYFMARAKGMLLETETEKFYLQHFRTTMEQFSPGYQRWINYGLELAEDAFNKAHENCIFLTSKGRNIVSFKELEVSCRRKNGFEIFIDFINHEMLLKGRIVKIFQRQKLCSLLLELVREPGAVLRTPEIFELVFGNKYEQESDGNSVRNAIYQLRLLLRDNKNEHFIRSSPEKGSYFFNLHTDFCIVLPQDSRKRD
ncbi:MAG: NB-ARC domain-containing protein [Candidatus Wallbacteria bacterium]|nr:NB-ARC domain-containing protein [Candidatus Wallbacteria bacterium]